MRLKLSGLLILTALVGGYLYGQEVWWRQQDTSRNMAVAVPGEQTRSASPQIPVMTERGVEIQQMDFDQMAKAIGLVLSLCGVFQYLLTRLIIQPAIGKEVNAAVTLLKAWATEAFPSAEDFRIHMNDDKHFQEEMSKLIAYQAADHKRLHDLERSIIMLEAKMP